MENVFNFLILGDDSVGYFIEPTIVEAKDHQFKTMKEEIFGPVLTVFVYPHSKYEEYVPILLLISSWILLQILPSML